MPTPMRAAAITSWVILFPENEGAIAAFGFVQHNFFILFNALIGVAFWRRARRELFGQPAPRADSQWQEPCSVRRAMVGDCQS